MSEEDWKLLEMLLRRIHHSHPVAVDAVIEMYRNDWEEGTDKVRRIIDLLIQRYGPL